MHYFFSEPIGVKGERIAAFLWPALQLTEAKGLDDRLGTDAKDIQSGARVQIKADEKISATGFVYREVWEKTKGKSEQRWRSSPHHCDEYIFVTCDLAIRIPVDKLAELELGQPLEQINPTSIGVRTSLAFYGPYLRWHELWPPSATSPDAARRGAMLSRLRRHYFGAE